MSKKMIQLDPKFMTLTKQGGKAKTKKKRELLKKSNIKNTGALRKQLLNKIKDFQKKSEENNDKPSISTETEEDFASEFNKSLHFLNNLSSKQKKKKKTHKNKNIKMKNNISQNDISQDNCDSNSANIKVSTELPTELLPDSNMKISRSNTSIKRRDSTPQYSCLKNGSKPTYREWKRSTQKNYAVNINNHDDEKLSDRELALKKVKEDFKNKTSETPISTHTSSESPAISIKTPQIHLDVPQELKPTLSLQNSSVNTPSNNILVNESVSTHNSSASNDSPVINTDTTSNSSPQECKRERRIRTTKYKLGRNKTSKLVGVLIKNRDTRRRITKEKDNLKKKTIIEVKNYLKKCNLLKSGSDAPPDVLRTMYEQVVLTGDVNNNAKDTLVHNYYNN